jgi:beta-1,4-mannosyltransferase
MVYFRTVRTRRSFTTHWFTTTIVTPRRSIRPPEPGQAGESGALRGGQPAGALHAVRVLQTAPTSPTGHTRFSSQVCDRAPASVIHRPFTWRRALLGRYDVVHVHWPEALLRSPRRWTRMAKRVLFLGFIVRLRVGRPVVVRTMHNVRPHEDGSERELRLINRLDDLAVLYVVLNDVTPLPKVAPTMLIPHGHYVDQFQGHPVAPIVPGRVLLFGSIQRYKGVEDLVLVAAEPCGQDLTFRIAGRTSDRTLQELIETACEATSRLTARLEFMTDADMVEEVSAAEVVILPYPDMFNSGILFVALSVGRPVIARRSPVNEEIRNEVGPSWMFLFDDALTAATLDAGVADLRSRTRSARPSMPGRDWDSVASAYADAFTTAAQLPSVRAPAPRTSSQRRAGSELASGVV